MSKFNTPHKKSFLLNGPLIQKILPTNGKRDGNNIFFIELDSVFLIVEVEKEINKA